MSRMLKELAGLSPWGWDARISTHPPGPASKRDFSEVDKLAHGGTTRRHDTSSPPPLQKRSATLKGKEKEKKVEETQKPAKSMRLPAKVDDLFGAGSGNKKLSRKRSSRDLNIQVDKSAKREKLIVRIPSKGPKKASEAAKKPSAKIESNRKRKDSAKGKTPDTSVEKKAPSTIEKKKLSKSDKKGARTPKKQTESNKTESNKVAKTPQQALKNKSKVAASLVVVEEAPVPVYVSKKHLALELLKEKESQITEDMMEEEDNDDYIDPQETRVNTLKVEKTFTSHKKKPYEDIMKERSETELESLSELEEAVPWHMHISGDLAGLFGSKACGFRKRYQAPKLSKANASSAINKACSVLKALDKAHGWLWKRN